jgi:hypothetical protein
MHNNGPPPRKAGESSELARRHQEIRSTAMTQDNTRKTLTMTGTQPQNLEEQIRRRAYEFYEAQGREDGQDLNDWLRAEAEIVQRKSRTSAA